MVVKKKYFILHIIFSDRPENDCSETLQINIQKYAGLENILI